jgi:hypothetical protein
MSDVEVTPLYFGNSKPIKLMHRFSKLPKWQRELIREDMETAFENRIRVMERINTHGV